MLPVLSSADKLLEEGEEITSTQHPSRLRLDYLKKGGLAFLVIMVLTVVYVYQGRIPQIPFELTLPIYILLQALPVAIFVMMEVEHHALMYHFTTEKFIEENGILNKDFSSVPYNKITQVSIRQRAHERLVGIGTLKVEMLGTDGDEKILNGIKNPQKFRVQLSSGEPAGVSAGKGGGEVQDEKQQTTDPLPETVSGAHITKKDLEAELGRVQRRRKELEDSYSAGRLGQDEYEQRWYMIQGEQRLVEALLDDIDQAERTGQD